MTPSAAGARARAEILKDSGRLDAEIAAAASCASVTAGRARRELEAAYGGAGNLESVTADLGSADTLDKSFLSN
ncbi:MAG TPA: hypothetical protein VMV92_44370 [Streptosporangiaceae bacterium]|nr:hypothetical protein [Streptosporangiaceae bacterium]HVB44866.1 hypothetical protein [Streptosporangiaceae bacterium]